jgi:hypothetical protein
VIVGDGWEEMPETARGLLGLEPLAAVPMKEGRRGVDGEGEGRREALADPVQVELELRGVIDVGDEPQARIIGDRVLCPIRATGLGAAAFRRP